MSFCIEVKATHIIGGSLTYTCLGNDKYRITLNMRRDCINGVALFDAPASIGIFDSTGNLLTQYGEKGLIKVFPTIHKIPIDSILLSGACLSPNVPLLCVEEATYIGDVVLPFRKGGYHFIYQRCCRNMLIQNIVKPLETGANWTVYLSEESLNTCNSSPSFKNWSPILLCAQKEYNFDHSAIDLQSDSLVYSLWTPFNAATDSTNPMPVPPSFNYSNVNWIGGRFNELNQFGSQVPFTIDRRTGMIHAIPDEKGHFLLGVKVQEYRNGKLLSTVYRDWQVEVVECGGFISDHRDSFEVCVDKEVNLPFVLKQEDLGKYNYLWQNNPLIISSSNTSSPRIIAKQPGIYILNTTIDNRTGCIQKDSIKIIAKANPELNFETTIINGTTTFINKSKGAATYFWDFGDIGSNNNNSTEINPKHFYANPGVYTVTLSSKDLCTIPFIKRILIKKDISDIIPSCLNRTIEINRKVNPSFRYHWTPANKVSDSLAPNPSTFFVKEIKFTSPLIDIAADSVLGTQTVLITPIFVAPALLQDTFVCEGESSIQLPFIMDESYRNSFDFSWQDNPYLIKGQNTEQPFITSKNLRSTVLYVHRVDRFTTCDTTDSLIIKTINKPILSIADTLIKNSTTVKFTANASVGVSHFRWDFGDNSTKTDTSSIKNPQYQYPDSGSYTVKLSTTDSCGASVTKIIKIVKLDTLLITDTIKACIGDTISINKNPKPYRYNWSPANKLSNATDVNPMTVLDIQTLFVSPLIDSSSGQVIGRHEVLVIPIIIPNLMIPDFPICAGDMGQMKHIVVDPLSRDQYTYAWGPNPIFIKDLNTDQPTITSPGVKGAVLYVTRTDKATGCKVRDSILIKLKPKPALDFDWMQTGTTTIKFKALADTSITYFRWDFGVPVIKSDTSNLRNPEYKYPGIGTYDVTLLATKGGCDSMITKKITISKPDTIITDTIPACVGDTAYLNRKQGPYRYSWTPTNKVSNTIAINPFTIVDTQTLFVSQLIDTITGKMIGRHEVLVVPISYTKVVYPDYPLCKGTSVSIVNIFPDSLKNIYNYTWLTNPFITIIKTQNKDSLVLKSPDLNGTILYFLRKDTSTGCSIKDSIRIILKQKPVVKIDTMQIGTTVKFKGLIDSTTTSFKWDFGVLTITSDTSTLRNPTYTYPGPGNYQASLIAVNDCGIDTATKIINIPIPNPLEFRDTITACKNDTVKLSVNRKTGSQYRYEWSPANKVNNPNAFNPVFIADSNRIFTAKLFDTVTNIQVGTLIVLVNVRSVNQNLPDTIPVCEVVPTGLNPSGNATYTYEWTPSADLNDPKAANPIATVKNLTKFFVKITDPITNCFMKDSIVVVPYLIALSSLSLDSTITVCRNKPFPLNPNSKSDTNLLYKWSPGKFLNDSTLLNPTATINNNTLFTLQLSDKHLPTCVISKSILLKVINVPALDSITPPDSTLKVCVGVSTPVYPKANPQLKYEWSPAQFFDQPMSPNPNVTVTNTQLVTVRIIDPKNPTCDTIIKQIRIIPSTVSVTPGFIDTVSCTDTPIKLYVKNVSPGISYEWFDGTQSIVKKDTVSVIPSSTKKTYKVIAMDTMKCMAMGTVTVTSAKFTADAVTIGPSGICPGQSTKLNANIIGFTTGLTYRWTPTSTILSGANTANPEVKPDTSTIYTVNVTNVQGCMSSDTVLVRIYPVKKVTASADPTTIPLGQSSKIIATNIPGYKYKWSPGNTLNDSTIYNPVAKPILNTTYTLTVTTPDNCSQTTSVNITVIPPDCAMPYIFLPNAFTPNGDGKNDVLYLRANNITSMSLVIYNRWGEKVFESRSLTDGWDGTYKGKQLYPDVFGYYLIVDCGSGQKLYKQGNVTLLR